MLQLDRVRGLRGFPSRARDLDGDGDADRWVPSVALADGTRLGPSGAEVLVRAAQDYYDTARSEIRHQIREPLERFYAEIDRLVENYVPDDGAVPQA